MKTPAEEKAERDGLRVVAVPTLELVRVAQGHPLIVGTLDGEEVLLRLPTPDEVMNFHIAACATVGVEPSLTRCQAEGIVRPMPESRP